ncbi:methylated-DNA--[protein]-cysteine S-methyltransferase [Agromyces atrinae]|uniref:Methylated-DNA--protein-cysteine methyltransferase n=1 Tax=Agromyces atrinae TaxID=592376 RepID=A0A4Q2M0Z7_9MICO|nr:methylated-DNA--[protein]-cysteine S-methyltransferase [Agromyces atrinae]NYD65753.1 methylated-DNA-[protein]-cysteine S-methyltransferase [Agromyces atrinae]RXZ85545.1 methylated-DNA--[protein]-cysteine S-methyltransferase [Agromyces atrinae]
MTESLRLIRLDSPIGRIEVRGTDDLITGLSIERAGTLPHDDLAENPTPALRAAKEQLEEYFAGVRQRFDLPLSLPGTPFQQSVWRELDRLGWGECVSYGQLAEAVGRPGSARAIGGAVGANPIPLLVACHRVLGSNGAVTGYSAGEGVATKLWLLGHEQIIIAA